ncbi:MAG: hypothetical protein ABI461_12150, partial [Polyangiaceae bacterium]
MRRTLLFAAVALASAATACAAILGIDDVTVRPGNEAGASGDDSSSDGANEADSDAPGICVPCLVADQPTVCAIACDRAAPSAITFGSDGMNVFWAERGDDKTPGSVWQKATGATLSESSQLVED